MPDFRKIEISQPNKEILMKNKQQKEEDIIAHNRRLILYFRGLTPKSPQNGPYRATEKIKYLSQMKRYRYKLNAK